MFQPGESVGAAGATEFMKDTSLHFQIRHTVLLYGFILTEVTSGLHCCGDSSFYSGKESGYMSNSAAQESTA